LLPLKKVKQQSLLVRKPNLIWRELHTTLKTHFALKVKTNTKINSHLFETHNAKLSGELLSAKIVRNEPSRQQFAA